MRLFPRNSGEPDARVQMCNGSGVISAIFIDLGTCLEVCFRFAGRSKLCYGMPKIARDWDVAHGRLRPLAFPTGPNSYVRLDQACLNRVGVVHLPR
jgi:hypothetical protein